MLSPSAPTILFKHLFFNNQKYGGVIQLFSPHIRPILPIIRSFAMTLLHQIFRQAQSSICLNSPVLLNSTLFPDRFTVLRINATFQKVGIVCGTAVLVCALHRRLHPTVSVSNACTQTFLKVGTVSGDPPPYLPRSAMRRAISCSFMPTIASPRSSDSSAIILASV